MAAPTWLPATFRACDLCELGTPGPAAARNMGTQLCTGEFIQYLDADDLLAPGKLRRQSRALIESDADVAYGDWSRATTRCGRIVSRRIEGDARYRAVHRFLVPAGGIPLSDVRSWSASAAGGDDLPVIQDARFVLDCALSRRTLRLLPGRSRAVSGAQHGFGVDTRSRSNSRAIACGTRSRSKSGGGRTAASNRSARPHWSRCTRRLRAAASMRTAPASRLHTRRWSGSHRGMCRNTAVAAAAGAKSQAIDARRRSPVAIETRNAACEQRRAADESPCSI